MSKLYFLDPIEVRLNNEAIALSQYELVTLEIKLRLIRVVFVCSIKFPMDVVGLEDIVGWQIY